MRARAADTDGFVERDGVKIHYEVHGDGGPTILLLPTWTIIHKEFWKAQVPFLARHFRVVLYDGPGNGQSNQPLDPLVYAHSRQVDYAVDVLEATTGSSQAVIVGLSMGCCWALMLVMFAAGVTNLVWMAGLAAVMAYEKTGRLGREVTPVVGAALLAWAALVLAHPAWLPHVLAGIA